MLKTKDKAQLYHELSRLCAAGFPPIKAAGVALDAGTNAAGRRFLKALRDGVADGLTVAEAAGTSGAGITPLEVSVLNSAEEGGSLEDGFDHLAVHFEARARAASSIRVALIYPAVLIHLAVLLPALVKAVQTRDLPGAALGAAAVLAGIYLVSFLLWRLYRSLSRKARTDAGADRLLRRVPLLGKARSSGALARFAEVLRIQLRCGRGPRRGIRSAAEASDSALLARAVRKFVLPEVEAGRRAGPGFAAAGKRHFPPAFAQSYATAEEAGDVDDEMARWAIVFADDAETALRRLAGAAPKVVYVLAAAYVAWQAYRMYAGYLDQIRSML